MSVVVFDGKDRISADSYMAANGIIYSINKLVSSEHFVCAFVGDVGIAQEAVDVVEDILSGGAKMALSSLVSRFNEWVVGLPTLPGEEAVASVLCVPRGAKDMFLWEYGSLMIKMPLQPIYLGAEEGESLYNYFIAIRGDEINPAEVVRACVLTSEVSNCPFAKGPVTSATISAHNV